MPSNNEAAYLDAARSNPLTVKSASEPGAPSSNQVVIKAKAIAVNPMDAMIQQTLFFIRTTKSSERILIGSAILNAVEIRIIRVSFLPIYYVFAAWSPND